MRKHTRTHGKFKTLVTALRWFLAIRKFFSLNSSAGEFQNGSGPRNNSCKSSCMSSLSKMHVLTRSFKTIVIARSCKSILQDLSSTCKTHHMTADMTIYDSSIAFKASFQPSLNVLKPHMLRDA
jgi:hypothetical protein